MPEEFVNVRYMVDDVDYAVAFYTAHFGFELRSSAAPAFADVVRGQLRLLLSGPTSSAGRPMPDGRTPHSGGWNRIHLIVDDLAGEVERLQRAGLTFRNHLVSGPGGTRAHSRPTARRTQDRSWRRATRTSRWGAVRRSSAGGSQEAQWAVRQLLTVAVRH